MTGVAMAAVQMAPFCAFRLARSEVVQRAQFHVRQAVVEPAAGLSGAESLVGIADVAAAPTVGREPTVRRLVIHAGQGELLEVVLALQSPGRLPRRLHGRKQQRDQDADDRDNDQKFY